MKEKKIQFPYKVYKGELYPIINIQMKGPSGTIETEAYVDTGASVSIFLSTIGFSAHLGADFNLLGQKDIFDRFIVTFDKREGTISFQPY